MALHKLAGRMRGKLEESSLLRLFDPTVSVELDRLAGIESDLSALIAQREHVESKGRAA